MFKKFLLVFVLLLFAGSFANAKNIFKNYQNKVDEKPAQYAITTVGALPAGSLITDNSEWTYINGNNYVGEIWAKMPVYWRKLEDNHYMQGTTLFLSEFNVARYNFCFKERGDHAWNESDARQFLQGKFYNHLSEKFKSSIVDVDIPYTNMKGEKETVKDNLFLLSIKEWNAMDKKGIADKVSKGTPINYEYMNTIYVPITPSVASDGKINLFRLTGNGVLTRTINLDHSNSSSILNQNVWTVHNFGGSTSKQFLANTILRPAVNLKSSTVVEGPYILEGHGRKLEYYVIK